MSTWIWLLISFGCFAAGIALGMVAMNMLWRLAYDLYLEFGRYERADL